MVDCYCCHCYHYYCWYRWDWVGWDGELIERRRNGRISIGSEWVVDAVLAFLMGGEIYCDGGWR